MSTLAPPPAAAPDPALPGLVSPWFAPDEYAGRLARLRAGMEEAGLDALVLLQPESVTWLTGFFTRGYGSFNFVLLRRAGAPVVFFRHVEDHYFRRTATLGEARHWTDGQDPVAEGAALIARHVPADARLGAELGAWTLPVAKGRRLFGDRDVTDASTLTSALRLVKSSAEIALMRAAGRAAEAGMTALVAAARPGASEREIAADASAAMMRAGSDIPGPGVLSSGEGALHLHGSYTDRRLEAGDLVQFEAIPAVRHHHARFMRPIRVAQASGADREIAERLAEIQDAALAAVAPGVPAHVPDRICREGLARSGLAPDYPNKTFYSVGFMLPPVSGEPLEATPGASWEFQAGMTFHSYLLVQGFGMSETIAVTADGHERLTRHPRRLLIGGEDAP